MFTAAYVIEQRCRGPVRAISIHGFPSTGIVAHPPWWRRIAFTVHGAAKLHYGTRLGQGGMCVRDIDEAASDGGIGAVDCSNTLICSPSPVLNSRAGFAVARFKTLSVVPLIYSTVMGRLPDDWADRQQQFARHELQPGVWYPIEISVPSVGYHFAGSFNPLVALELGVFRLSEQTRGGDWQIEVKAVSDRPDYVAPTAFTMYRMGHIIADAESSVSIGHARDLGKL